jgi:hypothetical protein
MTSIELERSVLLAWEYATHVNLNPRVTKLQTRLNSSCGRVRRFGDAMFILEYR